MLVWYFGAMLLVFLRERWGTRCPQLSEKDYWLGPITVMRLMRYDLLGTRVHWDANGAKRGVEATLPEPGDSGELLPVILGIDTKSWFSNPVASKEDDVTTDGHSLHKAMNGEEIRRYFQGRKIVTPIGRVLQIVEKQRRGQPGDLIRRQGRINLFFSYDVSSALRCVAVRRSDKGWEVDAYSLEGIIFPDGTQVCFAYDDDRVK